jgi:hypothetical protein
MKLLKTIWQKIVQAKKRRERIKKMKARDPYVYK